MTFLMRRTSLSISFKEDFLWWLLQCIKDTGTTPNNTFSLKKKYSCITESCRTRQHKRDVWFTQRFFVIWTCSSCHPRLLDSTNNLSWIYLLRASSSSSSVVFVATFVVTFSIASPCPIPFLLSCCYWKWPCYDTPSISCLQKKWDFVGILFWNEKVDAQVVLFSTLNMVLLPVALCICTTANTTEGEAGDWQCCNMDTSKLHIPLSALSSADAFAFLLLWFSSPNSSHTLRVSCMWEVSAMGETTASVCWKFQLQRWALWQSLAICWLEYCVIRFCMYMLREI